MIRILILADDLTGALDTGVTFACRSSSAVVYTGIPEDADAFFASSGAQAAVINTGSRHLLPEDAYRIVNRLSEAAVRAGVPFLYKKTDSALRGNIGSELGGMRDAAPGSALFFLPAAPSMNRIVRNSRLFIDGVPAENSAFGKDPRNPVRLSHIPSLLQEQYTGEGIHLYDSVSVRQMRESFLSIMKDSPASPVLFAGCFELADILAEYLYGNKKELPPSCYQKQFRQFFVLCGSINPVSSAQADYAAENGFCRRFLTWEQKLDPSWSSSPHAEEWVRQTSQLILDGKPVILDCNTPPGEKPLSTCCQEKGLSEADASDLIPLSAAALALRLLHNVPECTVMIIGGDTLQAFLSLSGIGSLSPVGEAAPGTVISRIQLSGHPHLLLSKSGGFGKEQLLTELTAAAGPIGSGTSGQHTQPH